MPPEDYDLWCELNPCATCDGTGEICDGDSCHRLCGTCDGSGVDPDAQYEEG